MKKIGIGIIGLGNIGSRLYKEIVSKKVFDDRSDSGFSLKMRLMSRNN